MMADYGKIEYFVIDVDGTMTDAGIYYDDSGNELKKFCTKDAAGFFTAHAVGMKIMVLTGRECKAVTRRMQEMSVEFIFQNIKDKKNFLISFLKEHGIEKEQLGYIGDDLNDLPAMSLAGFVVPRIHAKKFLREQIMFRIIVVVRELSETLSVMF